LFIVFFFIGHDQRIMIVEKYDIISLYPKCSYKCYYYLHPLTNLIMVLFNREWMIPNSLDIFEMTREHYEPIRNFVNNELLIFRRYQVDVKETL